MEVPLQTVGVFLTAFGAFVGTLVIAYRGLSGDRFTRKVSESAALLSGYTEMVKNLRLEIGEIRLDHDKEVIRNRSQCQEDTERTARMHKLELDGLIAVYAEERKHWDEERVRLKEEMDTLKEKIDELGTEVYYLKNRPPESKNREGDVVT